ncbi:MAG TPA: ATP-binding protein [Longimicrobiales bacterium]
MQANFVLELPSDLRAIERAVDHLMVRCREVGFDCDRVRLKLRVGVSEALANAMLYGNARDPKKRVLVEAYLATDTVTVRVTDEGRGFDPDALPDPTLPGNRTRPRGRGIFLIRTLMDRVEFNERGNSITMVLHGSPAAAVEGGAWAR